MLSNYQHADSSLNGQQLGRYRVIATLGQGGMGTIHLALAAGLGGFQKLCVLKELRQDLVDNERFVQMFLQEAKLAARLSHINVVATLEAAKFGGRYFLAMEFLDGQPLSEVMRREQATTHSSLQLRLQIICDVLAGLHYAHELRDYADHPLSIVHRDVSPHNVFLTYGGVVKVMDFGIAKANDGQSERREFRGKVAYAAPEQLRGDVVDRRCDLFAVGVMLWETIALRRLVEPGAKAADIAQRRLKNMEPALQTVVPDLDPVLAEICGRALSHEPQARFSSAEEFRSALVAYTSTLGPWLEPNVLGRFLETQFATERAAMQQLIRTNVQEEVAQTGTRSIPPSPTTPPPLPSPTVATAESGEAPGHDATALLPFNDLSGSHSHGFSVHGEQRPTGNDDVTTIGDPGELSAARAMSWVSVPQPSTDPEVHDGATVAADPIIWVEEAEPATGTASDTHPPRARRGRTAVLAALAVAGLSAAGLYLASPTATSSGRVPGAAQPPTDTSGVVEPEPTGSTSETLPGADANAAETVRAPGSSTASSKAAEPGEASPPQGGGPKEAAKPEAAASSSPKPNRPKARTTGRATHRRRRVVDRTTTPTVSKQAPPAPAPAPAPAPEPEKPAARTAEVPQAAPGIHMGADLTHSRQRPRRALDKDFNLGQ